MYGDDHIPDLGNITTKMVGDNLETKNVVVWDNVDFPNAMKKMESMLDSLIKVYQVKYPLE